ncbi:hypothetical protein [Treponema sp.]|uniref:EF-Tu C-terminal domain-related protein n=1 Tax=Treponema sp. TaxID=166 RepID=UPI00298E2D03|nr:hypothetical protein [Treponema sp.]MCR5614479.1 hypothetical protein [Treponema sp.]
MKEYIAYIYFLLKSEGGRKKNIPKSKYAFRPLFYFSNENYDCQIEFDNTELICLGNTYKLRIKITDICPIKVGDTFELKEFSTIAKGRVLEIL